MQAAVGLDHWRDGGGGTLGAAPGHDRQKIRFALNWNIRPSIV
jgi:hypothetical protein